mgnify:CR=1 FL=1
MPDMLIIITEHQENFVETNLNSGNDVILEIETKGALQVKKNMPEAF